ADLGPHSEVAGRAKKKARNLGVLLLVGWRMQAEGLAGSFLLKLHHKGGKLRPERKKEKLKRRKNGDPDGQI
ncbi:hypothetical protein PYX50_26110, partial [Serratia marcescens]|nr:hypothetical protein [Serratia marcescens]